jgi:hypothetical protein
MVRRTPLEVATMRLKQGLLGLLAAGACALAVAVLTPAAAPGTEEPAGQALFLDTHKCNTCHAVASAGIAAKTDRYASPDLGGYETDDAAALGRYLRKEEPREGEDHKKTFEGTDEELQGILDWLSGLEAAPAE